MIDATEREIEKMLDAEQEYQEIEARKTPAEKIMDLLKAQERLLAQAIVTCHKIEAELLGIKPQ